MSNDDKIILDNLVDQELLKNYPGMKKDDFFEIFTAEQILKSRSLDLTQDEIESGIMGQGHAAGTPSQKGPDGGIDSFYVFVNRKLIREDTPLEDFKNQQIVIDVITIQSKNSPGFSQAAIDKLTKFVEQCLRLSATATPESISLYKQALRDSVARFHEILKGSLTQKPTLNILFYYASTGDQISDEAETARGLLLKKANESFSTANVALEFFGAKELLSSAMKPVTKSFTFETKKIFSMGKDAHVCLIELGEFYKLIDDGGEPRESLFESNVRDHAGDVRVNREISATLAAGIAGEDFWWLNNGITIIASDATAQGDYFTVTDPLIVNGLQTSYEVHKHFKLTGGKADVRRILIRIIKTTDLASIDRVIRATNSQTKIGSVWLHATEDIHRKIEVALKSVGLYYDRRKNFYKNQGKPSHSIITIPYLSQALATIVLQRPDDARARPSTVVEAHYKSLFPSKPLMDLYPACARILRRVDEYLEGTQYDRIERLNLSFYLAMYATCTALKSAKPQRKTIASFDLSLLDDAFLKNCCDQLLKAYPGLEKDDRKAKGPDVASSMRKALAEKFSAAAKAKKKVGK